MAGGRDEESGIRRRVLRRCSDDRHFLPSFVPVKATEAAKCIVFYYTCRSGESRFSGLPAVQTEVGILPACERNAHPTGLRASTR